MNREVYPAGIYPLTGDVKSQAGSAPVTVVGLQSIPVANAFVLGGEWLEYNTNSHQWEPTLRATIQVNNLTVSDDADVSVNLVKPITVNGA